MIRSLKLTALLMLSLFVRVNAQIEMEDTKKFRRITEGQTYVRVKTTTFPGADKFLEAMRKDWTLTKGIHYLPSDNATITIQPNDSFLSLSSLTLSSSQYGTHIYYFLDFWTYNERDFKKHKPLEKINHDIIGQVALSVSNDAFATTAFFHENDFDGGGMIMNWSPGMVHNYLQQMTTLFKVGKKTKFQDGIKNKAALAALKEEILYVPDFDLIKSGTFKFKQEQRDEDETNDLFKKYTYTYKVITKDTLDKLILTSEKPTYYLLFIRHSTKKLVCVINGQTGETIYSEATSLSQRLKAGDVSGIFNVVRKS
jgi:hypothetical protein